MDIILDPATVQRIQGEIAPGRYREPAEVIASAMALFATQQREEEWLRERHPSIHQRLTESTEQAEHGELYTPEEVRRILAERRAVRQA